MSPLLPSTQELGQPLKPRWDEALMSGAEQPGLAPTWATGEGDRVRFCLGP